MTNTIKYETQWHGIPMVVEYEAGRQVNITAVSSKLDHSVVVLSRADMEELKRKCERHRRSLLSVVPA